MRLLVRSFRHRGEDNNALTGMDTHNCGQHLLHHLERDLVAVGY